ncbi:ATP-dependent Clp protease adapter ClpS [Marinospirillum insulare]|uniref:ATP-dependent Clp protease adapter protein ClpS n=1 Tax=Marinospirillum insulare TaxID=217169 RepID=A0ABQ5ZWV2_9GAMM|nr:ATP-dependent Clp protease adapter ClpS [Marinospirillum insulare]GLR63121.1 ATP-dependent Clp protease adapter protein ClpS [Marinospirillum insulare]
MSEDGQGGHLNGDLATATAKPKLEQPPRYKVIMLNDDFTPMEFVVEVLMFYFHMDMEKATQVMLDVHQKGRGVCGVFSKDVAETKAALVIDFARENEHPLMCNVEVAE